MNYEDNKNLEGEFLEYALTLELAEETKMSFLELKALKDGIDVFKAIKEIKDGSTYIDLQRTILTMDRALFELEEELLNKDKEIAQLKEKLNKPQNKQQLTQRGAYWYEGIDETNPVCSGCYDSKDKVIRLVPTDYVTRRVRRHNYQCPSCQTTS